MVFMYTVVVRVFKDTYIQGFSVDETENPVQKPFPSHPLHDTSLLPHMWVSIRPHSCIPVRYYLTPDEESQY